MSFTTVFCALFAVTKGRLPGAFNGSSSDWAIYRPGERSQGTPAIHVQLTWPQVGSDFDLHFIRPGGTY